MIEAATLLLLAAGAASAPVAAAPPDEPIVDARPIDHPLPGALKAYSVRYPYDLEVLLTIDRVGRIASLSFPGGAPTGDVERPVRAALSGWRFWPALGACRHVAQQARVRLRFDERGSELAGIEYLPVAARRTLADPAISWLFPPDAHDGRERPRQLPTGASDPVPLKQVMPRYPANASRQGQQGYAFVLLAVGADGRPGKVVATDAWSPDPKLAPLFAKESVAALRQWQFHPSMLGGKPRPQQVCQRFMFNLDLGVE
jgi:hypothetical protein